MLQNNKFVRSLDHAFESSHYFLDVLLEEKIGNDSDQCDVDDVLMKLVIAMGETTNTGCSGIDTGYTC